MNNKEKSTFDKYYIVYLAFMLVACGGALVWQFFLPQLAERFSSWGSASGWQREIALWNIGMITAIGYALIKKEPGLMRLITIQSTVLCWALGVNHLIALIVDFSANNFIHILGVFEVMCLGGGWGTIILLKSGKQNKKHD